MAGAVCPGGAEGMKATRHIDFEPAHRRLPSPQGYRWQLVGSLHGHCHV